MNNLLKARNHMRYYFGCFLFIFVILFFWIYFTSKSYPNSSGFNPIDNSTAGGYDSPFVFSCSGENYNYCHKPLLDFQRNYVYAPPYNLRACVIPKSISTVMAAIICLLYDTEKFLANKKTINKEYSDYRFCGGFNEAKSIDAIKAKENSNYTDENAHLWTHTVVIREPMERFVSGFLDKCVVEKIWLNHKWTCFGCKEDVSCFLKQLD
ncbi:hypothetical protein FO519_009757, partial [Halicephalobus sp. NKZ332]